MLGYALLAGAGKAAYSGIAEKGTWAWAWAGAGAGGAMEVLK